MTKNELASHIDATLVRNNHTLTEIDDLITKAKQYHFASVFILPCYTQYVAQHLAGTGVLTGGVIGFPWGGECTESKVFEAKLNLKLGAQEMDMVINLGFLLSGKYEAVRDDIRAVKDAIGDIPLKCILECAELNDNMIVRGAELIMKGGADYLKTATGFNGTASLEQVRLIKSVIGNDLRLKVAGGIRDLKSAEAFIGAGANRLGIGYLNAVSILDSIEA